jgi:DNA-binding NarL/FixJ family response regulator
MAKNRTGVRGRTKVVVGTNDPATRAGIRVALTRDEIHVCAEVDSVVDLLAAVQRNAPHVVLVDVDLRGGGLRAVGEIVVRRPSVSVVLLTEAESEDEFLEAINAGAVGYLNTGIAPPALSHVIRAVLNGEPAVPRALVPALINHYRDRPMRRHLAVDGGPPIDLTEREWQVLGLMRDGMSTGRIAGRLAISEVTVRRHIGSALKKLHVDSRADAVRLLGSA